MGKVFEVLINTRIQDQVENTFQNFNLALNKEV